MKLPNKITLHACAMGPIVPLFCIPASAQDTSLIPDVAAVKAMESECILIIEDRWPSYTEKYRKGQVKEELVKSCVENAKMQYFSTAENQMNLDSVKQATVALQEYQAALKKREEKIRSVAKAYEENMRRWREDVAACEAGDYSRCAQTVE